MGEKKTREIEKERKIIEEIRKKERKKERQ